MPEPFESHARTVSGLTLLSRLTGLARDATLSRVFGAGLLMDAFFFAFMVPNLFRRLFGEGAFAAAFLPVYARLERDDPTAARQLASQSVALLMIVLGGLVILGELTLFGISAAGGHQNLAVWLMMVMLPYMPLVCLVAVLGAMLQVHRRFGPTAAAPIILNLAMITAAIVAGAVLAPVDDRGRALHIGWVAVSVVLAGVVQMAWSLWAQPDQQWWQGFRARAGEPMRRVIHQALPMLVGLGVLQLNTFLDGLIASYPTAVGPTILGVDYPLQPGAMTAVSFAQRLYQFPLGVFGIALATAIFPALARQAGDERDFTETLRRGLRLVVFIGLPASVGLVLVRRPLVAVLLQGGAFNPDDSARVARVLLGYASGVWAYSMIHMLTRAMYARGDARTPVKVACVVVILNVALNCTLIWTPLREAGLAWSTAACAVVQVVALLWRTRSSVGPIVDAPVRSSWFRAAALTALMALAVGVLMAGMPPTQSWAASLAVLLGAVALGAGVILAGATALRMQELQWMLSRGSG